MKLKRSGKIICRAFLLLLAAAVCISFFTPAKAAEGKKVIRIPYGFNDFLNVDKNGRASGFYAGYLNKLAEYNGWEYEYVKTSLTEALAMLNSGELDLMYALNYSDERGLVMDFSNMPIGYSATGLFALESSGYVYNDFASFDGARIAFAKGSVNEKELEKLAGETGFTYEPVYVNTNPGMIKALEDGRADIAVFSAACDFPGGVLISVLDANPVYFAVKKGNDELLFDIDRGMQLMVKTEPDMVTEVFRKSMIGNNTGVSAMTEEERKVAESGQPIIIGFYVESEPLAYVDNNGEYGGIYIELLDYIKNNSGLNYVLYPMSRENNWQDLINDGTIDFYVGLSKIIIENDSDFRTTDALLSYSNIMVAKNDFVMKNVERPTIALTVGRSYWVEYIEDMFDADIDIKFYESAKECMVAVANGEADATWVNHLEFNYHSKNDRLSGLMQWHQYRFASDVCLAAKADLDDTVFSAVNKSIGLLPDEYTSVIIDENLSMPYHSYSFADNLYNARNVLMFLILFAVAAIILITIASGYRRSKRQIDKEVEENERRQLHILAATSYDYSAIYYIDLDADMSEPVNQRPGLKEKLGVRQSIVRKYSDAMRYFVNNYVMEEFRDAIMVYADPKKVIERFAETPQFSIRYQIKPDAREQKHFEVHFVQVEPDHGEHNMMVMGIRCIDETVHEEGRQRRALQDALDAANRANIAKSEFFSRMSHDIRTPLNAIIGMTAIAATHSDDPERVRDALGKITGASRHLIGLINDVLDMSKIETGKLSLAEEDINLSELIKRVLEIIQPQVKAHNHTLRVRTKDMQHENVIGDSLRIQQVFINILSNAVKYTPNGGDITFKIREIPIGTPKAGCYEFKFIDNGIGMTEEFQAHIFESFSRAEDSRVSKVQGTGLGMSIALTIVQMMNGTIEVKSELGKGSEFTVTIFLKLQESDEVDTSDLVNLPILVVDDDADACEMMCTVLNDIGMESHAYYSGQDAVDAVRRSIETGEGYYAAVLDWKMPGMDGLQTAKAIRHITDGKMSVIILSAYDWSEIEDEAKSAGVDGFLSKPVFKSGVVRLFKNLRNGDKERDDDLESLRESSYGDCRVLLVEDNLLNREIARKLLEMTDVVVEEAENGKIAVEMFASSDPGYYDLIFMDIQMPVMGGYEATRAIRSLKRDDAGKIPIVAMTANAFVEDIQAASASGMNEHLAKPIDFEKLNEVLEKYLKRE